MEKDLFSSRINGVADKVFIERWSPRSFVSDTIPELDLKKIIDAARWSPSTINEQPWLFFTASREASKFQEFIKCLNEGNQVWAKHSSVIGFVIARRFFKNKPKENSLADFDCGAAWMALTIQARLLGYYTHGMGGINRAEIEELLNLDVKKQKVMMGFALGKRADASALPEELRKKENPSSREELGDIWKIM